MCYIKKKKKLQERIVPKHFHSLLSAKVRSLNRQQDSAKYISSNEVLSVPIQVVCAKYEVTQEVQSTKNDKFRMGGPVHQQYTGGLTV